MHIYIHSTFLKVFNTIYDTLIDFKTKDSY